MNKVLLATDGSANSIKTAEFAANLFKNQPDIIVVLLTVIPQDRDLGLFELHIPEEEMEFLKNKSNEKAQYILNQTAKPLERVGIVVDKISKVGVPGETIADTAQSIYADQIIMGTRGHTFLKGLVLGSVAMRVLQLTKIPITLVKE
ncbi:UspA domain protein [Desulfofarcimen acetoxidans DSM 771]|jgi:nucleotide-binding universal stress UspA family protein|uniref:UspA domain protein n=1 Tax=Desulfofarcimen acetoxidans (strain ATCC 49208 / DSM 771 / KCTC 5769 / VKM B-1644 / 5575) TaxID=485916 RepID=C8W0G7_DESAS|nr:universal stress protein [Desulfofarcimen acetoxidans]ACV63222.1 UspA domain protein [Desulfofarcimen acetoxidans DSM 771]